MEEQKLDHKQILIKKAKEYSLQKKAEMDEFYKNHCLNNLDTLSVILKTHLYIENCLNELLKMNLPHPQYILDKSFSQKLDIFEALNLGFPPGNGLIETKLKLINKIRNSFAHNLDKKLTNKEFQQLAAGMSGANYAKSLTGLKSILMNIIGYLHALMAMNDFYPFLYSYQRNKSIFKKDVFWSKAIIDAYTFDDALESMDFLKF
ncbi:MAG: hypothetical protein HZA28_06575 [Candidatus Omnitrophica bacterium]|nr:hypothetical protein [Candidatus Omnitrophota bacterium]